MHERLNQKIPRRTFMTYMARGLTLISTTSIIGGAIDYIAVTKSQTEAANKKADQLSPPPLDADYADAEMLLASCGNTPIKELPPRRCLSTDIDHAQNIVRQQTNNMQAKLQKYNDEGITTREVYDGLAIVVGGLLAIKAHILSTSSSSSTK